MAETEAIISEEKSSPPPPSPPPPSTAPPPPPPPPPPPAILLATPKKKMSNACELDLQRAARNKETDSNIFALGEAVSQLDIDDVLSGVGSDFSELLNADDGSVTSTSCRLPVADHASHRPATVDKYTTVQVSSTLSCLHLPLTECDASFYRVKISYRNWHIVIVIIIINLLKK